MERPKRKTRQPNNYDVFLLPDYEDDDLEDEREFIIEENFDKRPKLGEITADVSENIPIQISSHYIDKYFPIDIDPQFQLNTSKKQSSKYFFVIYC